MNKRKPTMEHIPIMDLGLNCNEINALKTALYCILRADGGGGVQESLPQSLDAVKTQFFKQSVVIPFMSLLEVYKIYENIASGNFGQLRVEREWRSGCLSFAFRLDEVR